MLLDVLTPDRLCRPSAAPRHSGRLAAGPAYRGLVTLEADTS
jgi:hypothetical protein